MIKLKNLFFATLVALSLNPVHMAMGDNDGTTYTIESTKCDSEYKMVSVCNNTKNPMYVMHYKPSVGTFSGHKYITLPTLEAILFGLEDQVKNGDLSEIQKVIASGIAKHVKIMITAISPASKALNLLWLKESNDIDTDRAIKINPLSEAPKSPKDVIAVWEEFLMPKDHHVIAYRFNLTQAAENQEYILSQLDNAKNLASSEIIKLIFNAMGIDVEGMSAKLNMVKTGVNMASQLSTGAPLIPDTFAAQETKKEEAKTVTQSSSETGVVGTSLSVLSKGVGYASYLVPQLACVSQGLSMANDLYSYIATAYTESNKVYNYIPTCIIEPAYTKNMTITLNLDEDGIFTSDTLYHSAIDRTIILENNKFSVSVNELDEFIDIN